MKNALWITWEHQRRNSEIAKALGAEFCEISEFNNMKWYNRYICVIIKTFWLLLIKQPKIIICQNPSVVLSFLMVIIKKLTSKTVIVDAHHGGVHNRYANYKIVDWIIKFILINANLIIVTNQNHKKYIETLGGKAFILQDNIPTIHKLLDDNIIQPSVFVISSFDLDEPYEEILKSAGQLANVHFYFSGNYKKAKINLEDMPSNTTMLGYVSDEQFTKMLNSCSAIMVLTTSDNCLNCGAYEAIAVEKPFIISNQKALHAYFKNAPVYTNNTSFHITEAINDIFKNYNTKREEVIRFKEFILTEWQLSKEKLIESII